MGPGFQDRIDEAVGAGADLFLSLHINRNDDPTVWGTPIFVAGDVPQSVQTAETIGMALEKTGTKVTVVPQPWQVLKTSQFPTLMIELGHLTQPVERRLMMSRSYWEEASKAIVSAVDHHFGR